MDIKLLFWVIFVVLFFTILAIDMFVTGRRKAAIKLRTALFWTFIWITTSLCFAAAVYFYYPEGTVKGIEFITGYIIEYSLSIDNLFVFILIFTAMGIAEKNQPRILKWGILGAIVLRILFILAGVGLLHAFHFTIYFFGIVLVYTSYKMMSGGEDKVEPDKNPLVKFAKKYFNIETGSHTDHFFIKKNKIIYATLAFLTLLMVESTDVIFAVDSIPAVLSITHDPFIAITSNLFAILGLRSLFFAIVGLLNLFRYLKYGISFILLFIGVKMLISDLLVISTQLSLVVILISIIIAILMSVIIKPKEKN